MAARLIASCSAHRRARVAPRYYNAGVQTRGADQFGTYNLAINALRDGATTLLHVSPAGEELATHAPSCVGAGDQWTGLGDEVRASSWCCSTARGTIG